MRHWGRALIVGCLLLVIGFAAAQSQAANLAQTRVGTLDPLQGMVQVRQGDDVQWRTIVEPVVVGTDDLIRTGGTGRATLTFFEGVEADILPNSFLRVTHLAVEPDEPDEPAQVVIDLWLGDMLHKVDSGNHYDVHTPGAVITVRGTEFWTTVTRFEETRVIAVEGSVTITGVSEEGPGESIVLEAGQEVTISNTGQISAVAEMRMLPEIPPDLPLVPNTCGNGVCDAGENRVTCPVDCIEAMQCGDGKCDRATEDLISCPEDCGPPVPTGPTGIHFYWAMGRCDTDPPGRFIKPNVIMYWGVGCFDSAVHANAHPHPADYQMTIDDQPVDMSSLTQSGPNLHPPHCPWGWNFEMGPVRLSPGEHTMTLTETITDTWTTVTPGFEGMGRNAGEVVTLTCRFIVRDTP
jgi:hypothetical protein